MNLDDAVRQAVAAEAGDSPVVGWVVVAALLDDDGEAPLVLLPAEGQQPIATAGLLSLALRDGIGGQS